MTAETLKKLEWAFRIGCSESEAAFVAGIHRRTLARYKEKHADFVTKIEDWQESLKTTSRANLARAIHGEKDEKTGEWKVAPDLEASQWFLERKAKDEFARREEQTGPHGDPIRFVLEDFTADDFPAGKAPTKTEGGV